MPKTKVRRVWCDYCQLDVRLANVRGCTRTDCKSKTEVRRITRRGAQTAHCAPRHSRNVTVPQSQRKDTINA